MIENENKDNEERKEKREDERKENMKRGSEERIGIEKEKKKE